jgi:hypothetical protein
MLKQSRTKAGTNQIETKSHLINEKLSLVVGTRHGTSLTLAQRFNAGCDNEMKIESGSCRTKETLCRPDGTQQRGMRNALKHWAIIGTEYYEMACRTLRH